MELANKSPGTADAPTAPDPFTVPARLATVAAAIAVYAAAFAVFAPRAGILALVAYVVPVAVAARLFQSPGGLTLAVLFAPVHAVLLFTHPPAGVTLGWFGLSLIAVPLFALIGNAVARLTAAAATSVAPAAVREPATAARPAPAARATPHTRRTPRPSPRREPTPAPRATPAGPPLTPRSSAARVTRVRARHRDASPAGQAALARTERLRALGWLATGVAHEVNNPLAIITGNLALLQQELASSSLPEDVKQRTLRRLATARRGVDRAASVTRLLHRFADPARKSDRYAQSLNGLVAELQQLTRGATPAQVRIRYETSPRPVYVHAVPGELGQVAIILLKNGVEAVMPRGTVTVAVHATVHGAELVVSDDGPGITADARANLFTPFYTTKPDGIGLGLALAHAIITDHGGTISVDSTHRGTTFRIHLPTVKRDEKPPDRPPLRLTYARRVTTASP